MAALRLAGSKIGPYYLIDIYIFISVGAIGDNNIGFTCRGGRDVLVRPSAVTR